MADKKNVPGCFIWLLIIGAWLSGYYIGRESEREKLRKPEVQQSK
jgi:hypothetical protein